MRKLFSNEVHGKKAEELEGRFAGILGATSEEGFLNLFRLLEQQIYGTQKNLTNQLELAKAIVSYMDVSLDEVSADFPGFKILDKVFFLDEINQCSSSKYDNEINQYVKESNLVLDTVCWEDTGRQQNSAWGRNIADLFSNMYFDDKVVQLLMMRAPNFADVTADIDPDKFMVAVGNAKGQPLEQKSLAEILKKPWELLTNEENWPKDEDGNKVKLFAEGTDSQILVSSQICFVPIPSKNVTSAVEYAPAIRHYQSGKVKDDLYPAALTLVVTKQGTTIEALGKEDRQTLTFNQNGQKTKLTIKRPDEIERAEIALHEQLGYTAQDNAAQHNRILIIQIPLIPAQKPKESYTTDFLGMLSNKAIHKFGNSIPASSSVEFYSPMYLSDHLVAPATTQTNATVLMFNETAEIDSADRSTTICSTDSGPMGGIAKSFSRRKAATRSAPQKADIEKAVVGLGEADGKFDETFGKGWKRDPTLPIRVTVQLVYTTSAGKISKAQIKKCKEMLQESYDNASRIGSLVV